MEPTHISLPLPPLLVQAPSNSSLDKRDCFPNLPSVRTPVPGSMCCVRHLHDAVTMPGSASGLLRPPMALCGQDLAFLSGFSSLHAQHKLQIWAFATEDLPSALASYSASSQGPCALPSPRGCLSSALCGYLLLIIQMSVSMSVVTIQSIGANFLPYQLVFFLLKVLTLAFIYLLSSYLLENISSWGSQDPLPALLWSLVHNRCLITDCLNKWIYKKKCVK